MLPGGREGGFDLESMTLLCEKSVLYREVQHLYVSKVLQTGRAVVKWHFQQEAISGIWQRSTNLATPAARDAAVDQGTHWTGAR